jgi:hypothetical protein
MATLLSYPAQYLHWIEKAKRIISREYADDRRLPAGQVFRDRVTRGDWRVECEDEDGGIEVAIFSGPNARERAMRYADHHYRDFEEVSLVPY